LENGSPGRGLPYWDEGNWKSKLSIHTRKKMERLEKWTKNQLRLNSLREREPKNGTSNLYLGSGELKRERGGSLGCLPDPLLVRRRREGKMGINREEVGGIRRVPKPFSFSNAKE